MSDPINTTAEGGNPTAQEGVKTFTQEEVNTIISKRLQEDRARVGGDLARREQEIIRRELTLTATEKLKEKGLPHDLLDMLDLTSEETLEKGLQLIEKIAAGNPKPSPIRVVNTGGVHNVEGFFEADPIRKAMGLKE